MKPSSFQKVCDWVFKFFSRWIEWFIQSILYQRCIPYYIGKHLMYTADDNTCRRCRKKLTPMTINREAHNMSLQFILSLVTRLVYFRTIICVARFPTRFYANTIVTCENLAKNNVISAIQKYSVRYLLKIPYIDSQMFPLFHGLLTFLK